MIQQTIKQSLQDDFVKMKQCVQIRSVDCIDKRPIIYTGTCSYATLVMRQVSLLNQTASTLVAHLPLMTIFRTGSHALLCANSMKTVSTYDIPLINTLDGDLLKDVSFFLCIKIENALQIRLV